MNNKQWMGTNGVLFIQTSARIVSLHPCEGRAASNTNIGQAKSYSIPFEWLKFVVCNCEIPF
jgi:hypothetical protein